MLFEKNCKRYRLDGLRGFSGRWPERKRIPRLAQPTSQAAAELVVAYEEESVNNLTITAAQRTAARLSALYYQSKQVVATASGDYHNDLRGVDAGLSPTACT